MKKYKILIVFDAIGWCYHKRALALQKYAPNYIEIDIDNSYTRPLRKKNYDLVFFLPFSYIHKLRKYCEINNLDPVLLTSYNVGWGYANKWLNGTIKYSDAVIINNYEMWEKSGKLSKTYYIANGVDGEIFKNKIPIEKRQNKILWCGSKFHREVKGYDKFLIPLKQKLSKSGIVLDLKLTDSMHGKKLTSKEMATWYNTGSVYLCTSKTEGTPNPALEAAACGCSIVSTRVGNMPELVTNGENGYLVDRNVQILFTYCLLAIQNKRKLSIDMDRKIIDWTWRNRSQQFYNLFIDLMTKQDNL